MNRNLRILIICSGNVENYDIKKHHAFVYEQIETVKNKYAVEYDTLFIKGKGISGYLKNVPKLRKKIKEFKPDLIHAHYGLTGLLSCTQRVVPVVITFHGSEILYFTNRFLTSIAAILSGYNIFVTKHIWEKLYFKPRKNFEIIPCGINLDESTVVDKEISISKMKLDNKKVNVVFAGAFNDEIKNSQLAIAAIKSIDRKNINLIELKGYKREEVNYLLNACDLFLLTSISEASPQTIKEAMACNCPIVATNVGEIRDIISDTDGCFITTFEPEDIAQKIKLALEFGSRTNGREKITRFDNNFIAEKIYSVYKNVLHIPPESNYINSSK